MWSHIWPAQQFCGYMLTGWHCKDLRLRTLNWDIRPIPWQVWSISRWSHLKIAGSWEGSYHCQFQHWGRQDPDRVLWQHSQNMGHQVGGLRAHVRRAQWRTVQRAVWIQRGLSRDCLYRQHSQTLGRQARPVHLLNGGPHRRGIRRVLQLHRQQTVFSQFGQHRAYLRHYEWSVHVCTSRAWERDQQMYVQQSRHASYNRIFW